MNEEEITALGKKIGNPDFSDEKGEEMLTCDRDVVRMLYDRTDSVKVRQVLESIFGSKCLPDELNEDNFVKSEPKPAEPKFKVGDTASYICSPTIKHKCTVTKVMQNEHNGKWEYNVMFEWGKPGMWIPESDLEPYTEPTQQPTTDCSNLDKQASTCTNVCTSQSAPNPNPETVRNLRKSDEDSESEALLNQIPDTAKMVDNIIKDDFRDHNRLHIAAQITASIYSNDKTASQFDSIEALVRKALDITDTLIAEAERTDKLNK